MSLTTLTIGWLVVLVLFSLFALIQSGRLSKAIFLVSAGESLVLTLLAGLWFSTAGHGGWLMVFVLLGLLVAGAQRGLRFAVLRSPEARDWKGFVLDLARYVLAGALLAWRLG